MLNKEAGVHLASAVTLEQWKMGFLNVCSSLLVLHRLPWALWTFSILTPLRYGIAINTINMLWRDNKFKRVIAQNDTCNTDLRSSREVLFFQIDSLGSTALEISVFLLGYFLLSEISPFLYFGLWDLWDKPWHHESRLSRTCCHNAKV